MHVYTCIHIYTYQHMYCNSLFTLFIYKRLNKYTYVFIHICVYTYVFIYVNTCTYMYVCVIDTFLVDIINLQIARFLQNYN